MNFGCWNGVWMIGYQILTFWGRTQFQPSARVIPAQYFDGRCGRIHSSSLERQRKTPSVQFSLHGLLDTGSQRKSSIKVKPLWKLKSNMTGLFSFQTSSWSKTRNLFNNRI